MSLTFDVALQGGGSAGIALNPALAELFRRGHRVRRVVGTSAGSIAAALLAAGYTGDELLAMSLRRTAAGLPLFAEWIEEPVVPAAATSEFDSDEFDLSGFSLPAKLGRRLRAAKGMLEFVERGGFVSGQGLLDWLSAALEQKERGLSRVTLGELHERSAAHVTLIATDLSSRRVRALNHLTAPDLPLVWAVRASVSVPLYFTEVIWQESWGTYLGTSLADHVLVDGGVMSNLPIGFLLKSGNPLLQRMMGIEEQDGVRALGISLDGTLEVPGAPPRSRSAAALSGGKMGERVRALTDALLQGFDMSLADTDADTLLMRLPTRDYLPTEFRMSEARAEALVSAADVVAREFFDELER